MRERPIALGKNDYLENKVVRFISCKSEIDWINKHPKHHNLVSTIYSSLIWITKKDYFLINQITSENKFESA